jgi:dGTPase
VEEMKMKWDKLLSEVRVRDFFVQPERREKNNRTEFERDYDRAIFSTPVRRMHDKTQVFPLEPNDSVRTRLTHSLEVCTVARDMGRAIGRWLEIGKKLNPEKAEEQVRAIETITATCGLIHDLGNPPFGHAGEEAIAEWFKEKNKQKDFLFFSNTENRKTQLKNDFLKFEGNAQTIRLVSKLQILSDLYGLNFTSGTISAACKYIACSDKINKDYHEKKKVGYFASEELIIDLIRNETGTGEARNPITFIVEAADDIVFSVVDLEDGVKKGVIDWEELKHKLEEYSKGNTDMLRSCFKKAEKLIDEKDIRVNLKGKSRDEAMAQAFRVWAIGESVYAAIETFKEKYEDIMKGDYHNELFEDSKACSLIKACKEVGFNHVYRAEQNLKKEVMAERVIHDLMDIFWRGVSKKRDNPTRFEEKIYTLISHIKVAHPTLI